MSGPLAQQPLQRPGAAVGGGEHRHRGYFLQMLEGGGEGELAEEHHIDVWRQLHNCRRLKARLAAKVVS